MIFKLSNKSYLFSIFLSLGICFSACQFDCISVEGTGPLIEKSIVTENFKAIENNIPATININQGDIFSIIANGQANILDLIEFKVNDNKLSIDFNQPCVNSNFDSLSIFITLPNLTSLEINGSGQAFIENNLRCENLNLNVSGSGNIKASVQASKKLNGNISGSGSIDLLGSATDASLDISGSGEIHAFNFQTTKSSISISGSGNAEIYAIENLSANISGSGDIYYKGSPKIDSSVSGSGELRLSK